MGRILKFFGIAVGGLIVLLVVALVAVGMLFDPNDYKDRITTAVADATGRTLTLSGDLELQVLPRLRIEVGSATLSNAPGFGDAPFAEIEGAQLQLALLPLLSKRVEIDEARLNGLRLNLARDASGGNNWQDLSGSGEAAEPDAAADGGASATADLDLDVAAIQIADSEVSWRDAATASEWLLTNFNLEAEDFGLDGAFPLSIGFDLAGAEVEVSVESSMQATLALDANAYRLDGLEVSINGNGAGWPGGSGEVNASFDSFAANLNQETVELNNLQLEVLGLQIDGTLTGEQLFDDLALAGKINIAEFDPNDLLEVLGTQIETADDTVFRRASASADFNYSANQYGMSNAELVLDDSTLTGSIGMRGDALRFDLNVDSINIDSYLPPATEEAGSEDEGSVDEIDLPLEPLRTFAAQGELALGQTQVMGMTLTNANFALNAGNGRLQLVPTGTLYGGQISGEIGIEVQGESGRLSLVQRLTGVDLLGLARDYLDTEDLSGTGDVNLDLVASGSNVGDIRRALDGTVSFALTDGAWEGIDAWYEIRRARAVTDQSDVPAREDTARTTFSNVSLSGTVEDSVLTTNDLNATLPFMALNGAGTVNLLSNEIDIAATAGFVDGPVLQSDPAMAGLAGDELPLNVGGTLAEPSIRPDFGALVRAQVQEEVDEAVEEAKEEVQERLQDRLRGIFDR